MQAKYYIQKRQISPDGGITWRDIVPSETRIGTNAYPNDIDCGGSMDYSTVGMTFITTTNGVGWISESGGSISSLDMLGYSDVMREAYISDNINTLTNYSFFNYAFLNEVELPDTLTTIGDYCFVGCTALDEIIIPENVTSIGSYTFSGSSFSRIILKPSTPPSTAPITTYSLNSQSKVYVRDESVNLYQSTYPWSSIAYKIYPLSDLYEGVPSCKYEKLKKQESYESGVSQTWYDVGEYNEGNLIESASSDCEMSVTYRWTDTSAYTCSDFAKCDSYKAIYDYERITSGYVETIEETPPPLPPNLSAFYATSPYETICSDGNSSLSWDDMQNVYYINDPITTTANIDSIKSISITYVYRDYLTILEVGSVTDVNLGNVDTSHLSSLTLSSSVLRIGASSFSDAKISSVTIPSSVIEIGASAFYGCSNLTSIVIPNSVTSIGTYAFSNCTSLTSVTLPNSITSLGGTFSRCSSLSSITIPSSVTSLGNYVFFDCESLTSITFTSTTPPTITTKTFSSCNATIYVPSASLNTYKTAAVWETIASRIQPIS